jgi:hypothetical protein
MLAQGIIRDPLQRLHVCEQHHPGREPAALGSNGRLRDHAGESLRIAAAAASKSELGTAAPVRPKRRALAPGCRLRLTSWPGR